MRESADSATRSTRRSRAACGGLEEVVRDGRLLGHAALVGVDVGLHVDQVDQAGELVFLADRQRHGDHAVAKALYERRQHVVEVGALTVHHVDRHQPRDAEVDCAPPEALGLDLDLVHCVDRP